MICVGGYKMSDGTSAVDSGTTAYCTDIANDVVDFYAQTFTSVHDGCCLPLIKKRPLTKQEKRDLFKIANQKHSRRPGR